MLAHGWKSTQLKELEEQLATRQERLHILDQWCCNMWTLHAAHRFFAHNAANQKKFNAAQKEAQKKFAAKFAGNKAAYAAAKAAIAASVKAANKEAAAKTARINRRHAAEQAAKKKFQQMFNKK